MHNYILHVMISSEATVFPNFYLVAESGLFCSFLCPSPPPTPFSHGFACSTKSITILSFHSFFLSCGLLLMLLIHPFLSLIRSFNCLSIHLIVYCSHTHSPSPFSKLGKHWGDNRAVSGLCCPLVALWFDVMIGWPPNIPKVQPALLLTTGHSVLAGTGFPV